MTAQGVDDAAGRSQVEQLWCDACALLQEWDCQCNPEETLVSSQFGRIFIEVARRTQGNSCFAPAPPPSLQLSEYLHSIRHISQILSLCDLLLRMCSEGRVKYIAHQLALLYQALVSAKLPLDEARISIEACIPPTLPPLAHYHHSSWTFPPPPPEHQSRFDNFKRLAEAGNLPQHQVDWLSALATDLAASVSSLSPLVVKRPCEWWAAGECVCVRWLCCSVPEINLNDSCMQLLLQPLRRSARRAYGSASMRRAAHP